MSGLGGRSLDHVGSTVLGNEIVDELPRAGLLEVFFCDHRHLKESVELLAVNIVLQVKSLVGIPANVLNVLEVGWVADVSLCVLPLLLLLTLLVAGL